MFENKEDGNACENKNPETRYNLSATSQRKEILPPPPAGLIDAFKPPIIKKVGSPVRPWQPGGIPAKRPKVNALPRKWDWRNVKGRNWITPIRNQGMCGACVAFAVTAAVESHLMIERNDPNLTFDLSEASLFYAANRKCKEGDVAYGWFIPHALELLTKEGICFEENFPFYDEDQPVQFTHGTNRVYRISGYSKTSDVSQMKRWLVEEGPLITVFSVFNNFYTFMDNGAHGIYRHKVGVKLGNHAVLVIGYDDDAGCWICKNSHPQKQGNSGFFRIAYNTAGINNQMFLIQDVYPVDLRDEYCYDPQSLQILDSGPLGWRLIDGNRTLKFLDNQEDAKNALRIAQRHTIFGAIGKKNHRPNHMDYVIEYWRGISNLPDQPLTSVDCIPYDPTHVKTVDRDALGWELRSGNKLKLMADDMNDALAALRLMQRNHLIGYIGRGNQRQNSKQYVMTYWE